MPRREAREILQIMEKHSQRLNAIVEDLLTLARLESRELPLRPEPLDAADFLAQMARDWQVRATRKKIVIAVEAVPGLPVLSADPFRMEQVFNNLLDNAVKYTPEGGRVGLRAEPADGGVLFSVSDTGPGIPPASLPHIFERFYRVDRDRSRELGGTGLGLSIVKHIAAQHGGSVDAQSVYGQGTTIRVKIPACPPTA
jgi:signal transduction histidine kinase